MKAISMPPNQISLSIHITETKTTMRPQTATKKPSAFEMKWKQLPKVKNIVQTNYHREMNISALHFRLLPPTPTLKLRTNTSTTPKMSFNFRVTAIRDEGFASLKLQKIHKPKAVANQRCVVIRETAHV